MLDPLALDRINNALASKTGWVELLVIASCFGAGWLLDRHIRLRSHSDANVVRLGLGSVNRLLLPLATLVLLLLATAIFRRWATPFFLPNAIPLMVALAAIRLLVYALRELFGTPSWLPFSERVVSFTIWGAVLLHFAGVLPELRTELDDMQIPLGTKHVSILELLKGTIVVILTVSGSLWLSGVIEQRLMRAGNLDGNVRVVIGKVVRAVLLVAGVLVALQAVGIDLTLLTVFGGALGVGIGLGLQKLAANYIAGFAILLDRSIRLGDMITVDQRFGVVAQVTSRYVVVRSLDGVNAVVPNETLVTTTVLNHSYSNREIRVAVPFHVGYDTDVDLALRIMEEAAQAEPRVLKGSNAPMGFLSRFGENGIELELGVWINDPENGQLNLKSALNRAILKAFRAQNIELGRPPRQVHVLGVKDAFRGGAERPSPGPAA